MRPNTTETQNGEGWNGLTHTTHPKAFRLQLCEPDTDTVVDEFVFRYPPGKEYRWQTNVPAAAYAIQEQFLDPRGYTFIWLNSPDEFYVMLVIEKERLASLQAKYGDDLRLFADSGCDEPLLRDMLGCALSRGYYEPELEVDHESEYGIPEPPETYKLEEQPESQE